MMAQSLIDVRFALEEFDELERELRGQLEKMPLNSALQRELLETLVAAGKDDQATAAHEAYAQRASQPPGDIFQLALKSKMQLDYLDGRFEEFLTGARQMHDPPTAAQMQFEAALELGQLENLAAPAGVAAGRSSLRAMHELLLSLAWRDKHDQDRAAAARERAVAALAGGNRAERQAAERLQQAPALVAGSAEKLALEPEVKAVVLIALAQSCPEQKASLLALAGKLNYRREFPYQFLNRQLTALRGE